MRSSPMRKWSSGRRRDGERGYVTALTVVLIPVLVILTAFVVDVGQWWVESIRTQRAADAAALAGVVYLPEAVQQARDESLKVASINGYDHADADTVAVTPLTPVPYDDDGDGTYDRERDSQMRVTISRKVHNSFAGFFGFPTTTITRTAVADYRGPVPLGSPCNSFGAFEGDPKDHLDSAVCEENSAFWANVAGPATNKDKGDAFHAGSCAGGEAACQGSTNLDYQPNGYLYVIRVTEPLPYLDVDVYDPAFVDVGDRCEAPDGGAHENDPDCPGDRSFDREGTPVATEYTFRGLADNPISPLTSSEVIESHRFDGHFLTAGGAVPSAAPWRQWVNVGHKTAVQPGDYYLQIKTNGLGADDAAGHNRFAIRASSSSATNNGAISVFGYEKIGIFANFPGAETEFYLARVPSVSRGQVLTVKLFDTGDSNKPGVVSILPPDGNAPFTGCVGVGFARHGQTESSPVEAALPQVGTLGGGYPPCSLGVWDRNERGLKAQQGRWQYIQVPISQSYECDDSDFTDCWVRIRFDYSAEGTPTQPVDTTSWEISLTGDPVRLVE